MKLSIIQCTEYPSHEIEVQDSIAKNKGFCNQFKNPVSIINQTVKKDGKGKDNGAFLLLFERSNEEHWVPKVCCKIIKRLETKLSSF